MNFMQRFGRISKVIVRAGEHSLVRGETRGVQAGKRATPLEQQRRTAVRRAGAASARRVASASSEVVSLRSFSAAAWRA